MAGRTRLLELAVCLCLIHFCGSGSSFADVGGSVPFYKEVAHDPFSWNYCFFGAIVVATIIIEYPIIYFLLERPVKARMQLFLFTVLVNLVTNPVAQFSILFIADPVLLGSHLLANVVMLLIELVVVAVEFSLMIWIFRWTYLRGLLDRHVTATRTLVIALTANMASFAIGYIGFLLIIAIVTTYLFR